MPRVAQGLYGRMLALLDQAEMLAEEVRATGIEIEAVEGECESLKDDVLALQIERDEAQDELAQAVLDIEVLERRLEAVDHHEESPKPTRPHRRSLNLTQSHSVSPSAEG